MQFERQGATVPPRRHVAGKLIGTVILAVRADRGSVGAHHRARGVELGLRVVDSAHMAVRANAGRAGAGDVQRRSLRCLGWANPKSRGVVLGLDGFQLQRGANDPRGRDRQTGRLSPSLAGCSGQLGLERVAQPICGMRRSTARTGRRRGGGTDGARRQVQRPRLRRV